MLISNRKALEKDTYKGLLEKLDKSKKDLNIRYVAEEDKLFYKEKEIDYIDSVEEKDIKPYDVIILHGFGKGKVARALRTKFKNTLIIIFERNLGIIKEIAEKKDISDILKDKNTLILPLSSNYREEIDSLMTATKGRLMWADVYQYHTAGYDKVDFYEFKEIKEILNKFLAAFFLNRNTLLYQSDKIMENTLKNISVFSRGGPLRKFVKNKFKNKPAIIVSSGPSLMKNIGLLPSLKDRALIIAIDSVINTLYSHNIEPDIICGVDYTPLNVEKYKAILKEKKRANTLFIHSISIYHEIPKLFNKTIAECTSNGFVGLYSELFGKFEDIILPGNSNTHFAISIAYYLKANPIIFIGQDWAFSGGIDHAKESSVEVNIPGKIHWVKGNYEEKVPTDTAMFSGLKVVEDIVKILNKKGFKIINATEGGAFIEGTEVLTLEEAKNKYLKSTINKSSFELDYAIQHQALIKKTKDILEKIETTIKKATYSLRLLSDISNRWKKNKEESLIEKKVEKVNKINNEITFDKIFNGVVTGFYFKDFYLFNREEIYIEGQKIEKRINQSIKYFKMIKEKSIDVRKKIEMLLDFLKSEEELINNKERFLKDKRKIIRMLELCYEFKDIYLGIKLSEDAIKAHGNEAEFYYWKGKLCSLNRFMHKEALQNFKKALEINPKYKKALFDYEVEKKMVQSHMILAKSAAEKKDYISAKRLIDRALDYEPENNEIKKWKSVIEELAKTAKNTQRQNLLLKQLELEGEAFNKYKTAIEFVKKEQMEKAFDILKDLYEKYGNFGDIPFLLGSIYIDRKELDKAEKYLKEAVELIPYQPLVYLALGKLYIEKEDYAQAKENLEKTINMNPNLKPGVLDTLGNLYYEFGEYEKAFKTFEEYLQFSDDKIRTLTKIAVCYKEMGMINEYNMLMEKIKSLTGAN